MRLCVLPFVALLPAALADNQIPLMDKAAGWFNAAKSYIPSSIPDVISNPIDAGASEVAARRVERINVRNWHRKLSPKLEGEEEWMIYLTGGNKSCFGRCGPVDTKWNESVPLLSALPQQNLRLGQLDCEKDAILCTAWSASLPSIYHFLVPARDSPNLKTPLHAIELNISTTTVQDITSIPSSAGARYADYEEYDGVLHPFDGMLAKLRLQMPMAYALWAISSTPSWLMMIGISFVSRQIMSRRMGTRPGFGTEAAGAPQPAAGGAGGASGANQAAAKNAQGPASPRGGGGGKKKK